MSVEAKFIRDIDQYFRYPTDENPTTQQEYQEAVRNWVTTEEAIVDSHLWQPTTAYAAGNAVKTPSLPSQYVLVCTMAGTSGSSEPDYTNVSVGDSVTDGTVTWKVRSVFTDAGGTLDGGLTWNGTNNTTFRMGLSDVNADNVDIGWTYADKTGAGIGLRNVAHSESGAFLLWATDGTNVKRLKGTSDGVLTWEGIIENNGILAQASNNTNLMRLCGGNGVDNGATLSMWGKSHSSNAGEWRLRANDGTNDVQLIGYPNGNLKWAGDNVLTDGSVGTVKSNSISNSISLLATTAKTLTSVSLPAGTWVITGHVRFESVTASKLYAVELGNTANNFSYGTEGSVSVHSTTTGIISINTCRIITLNSTTTYYLCGYASAACSVTAAQIRAVRIV